MKQNLKLRRHICLFILIPKQLELNKRIVFARSLIKPIRGTRSMNCLSRLCRLRFGAMATHHITEKMVADKPAFIGSAAQANLRSLLLDPQSVVVAHNAEYDIGMLLKEGVEVPWAVCTLKIARTLDSEGEMESHKLQYLRYYYGMEINAQAHDAWGDILVLEQLFVLYWAKFRERFATDAEVLADMIRITQNPVLIPKINFGKHKGTHFREVPKDYLQWMLGQDFDQDILYTARYYLSV